MAGSPATIDKPLSISIRASHGEGAETSQTGRLHVGELRPDMVSGDQQFVAVLASSLNSPPIANHEELAIEGFLTGLNAGGELHLSEVMKQGFREANKLIHQATKASAPSGTEGVAMLAMLTRGKFATLGLVGPDRAYLLRANRLTQLTRDQRVARPKSRRKSDIEQQQAQAGSATAVQLLGEQERLDSRSPAIFEIALLPEDRLGLVSRGVLDAIPEERILTALGSGIDEERGCSPRSRLEPPMPLCSRRCSRWRRAAKRQPMCRHRALHRRPFCGRRSFSLSH